MVASCSMTRRSHCALHLRAPAEHLNNTNAHTTIHSPYGTAGVRSSTIICIKNHDDLSIVSAGSCEIYIGLHYLLYLIVSISGIYGRNSLACVLQQQVHSSWMAGGEIRQVGHQAVHRHPQVSLEARETYRNCPNTFQLCFLFPIPLETNIITYISVSSM